MASEDVDAAEGAMGGLRMADASRVEANEHDSQSNDSSQGNISDTRPQRTAVNDSSGQMQNASGVPWIAASQATFRGRGQVRTVDITERFREAAKELPVGSLVKDGEFTLFESVGALEIMDPKMDSGFLVPGEALEDDYDVGRTLLPEEVIGIMDQLLCYEMAWHIGHPLAQTLFTSHYIDTLLRTDNRQNQNPRFNLHTSHSPSETPSDSPQGLLNLLRAYCICLIKCCGYVIDDINKSPYYEEEDFSAQTYQRDFLSASTEDQVVSEIDAAMAWVLEQMGDKTISQPSCWSAMYWRLNTRKNMLISMSSSTSPRDKHQTWNQVIHCLGQVKKLLTFSKSVPESFSPKIQRRLASTTPPRPMVELKFDEAFDTMLSLATSCIEAMRLAEMKDGNVHSLKSFFLFFTARKPEPLQYPRACASGFVFTGPNGTFEQLLKDDLSQMVLANSTIMDPINWTIEAPMNGDHQFPDPRWRMATGIDYWVRNAVGSPGGYLDLFRALCSNRCRLRRNLCHIMNTFDSFERGETEELDEEVTVLSPGSIRHPLAFWSYHQKIQAMEWVIQLGFETDIYLPHELCGMYWHLSFVSRARRKMLNHMCHHLQAEAAKEIPVRPALKNAVNLAETLHTEAYLTEKMAWALYQSYYSLCYLHLLPDAPKTPYGEAELQFELRMKPFWNIDLPVVPPWDDFDDIIHPWGDYNSRPPLNELDAESMASMIETHENIEDSFARSKEFAQQLKTSGVRSVWNGLKDSYEKNCMSILTCAVVGSVSNGRTLQAVKLGKSVDELEAEIPALEKRIHPWWVVPLVTYKKPKNTRKDSSQKSESKPGDN